MALDSDIKNPDSHLQVTFYSRDVKNEFKTSQKAKEMGKEPEQLEPHEYVNDTVDYIKIQIPGNKNLEIDTPARDEHKRRFPMHWLAYQNRGDAVGKVVGTPIEQWPRISKEVAEELRHIRFNTIEAVAGASDAQLQAIGMIAGQNAFTFRDDARRHLATIGAQAKLNDAEIKQREADEKLAAAKEEMAAQARRHAEETEQMRQEMAQMQKQMAEFMAAMTAQAKAKPGRPPKNEQEAA
jgi:hypothetical protein